MFHSLSVLKLKLFQFRVVSFLGHVKEITRLIRTSPKYIFCPKGSPAFHPAFLFVFETHWLKSRHALRDQRAPIPPNLSPLTSTPFGP